MSIGRFACLVRFSTGYDYITVEERDYGDYFSVELVSKDKPISGGCLINRIRLFNILSENLAEKCTPNPLQTSTPRSIFSEQNGNDAQVVEISTSQSLSNFLTEPMENCALNTNGAQAMETEENVTMDYDIDVTRPLLPLEIPSTEFRAFVVFAPDPSDFTIRLECAQNFPQLIKQMTETDEFICQSPIETEPIPGHYYLAKVDNLWHRVYASENSRFKETDKYRVFLVDSGHFELVEIENIKEMILPLYEPQMMAIKCQLFGVKPTPPSHYWSAVAQTVFSSRVIDDAPEGIIVHVKGESDSWNARYACGLPKVKVDIFDAKTKQNIGEWLINNGCAIANCA